jgi:hypothetical protein
MSKLEKLKTQREELDKQIREMAAKQALANKKLSDRQKIIIGAWVMQERPALVQEIIANMTRAQDRAVFKDMIAPKPQAEEG